MGSQRPLFQIGVLLAIINIISGTSINGKKLRVGVSSWWEQTWDPAMGEILSTLKNALNFSTTFVYDQHGAGSGETGKRNGLIGSGDYNEETGEWNGLIGMIYRNEADFGLGKF